VTVDLTRSAVSAQSAQDALGTGGWGVFGLDAAGLLGPDPDPGTVLGASWFAGQIAVVDSAVGAVSRVRARLGAVQDGLERTADGLQQELQDTTAARSRITDADLGAEAAALARGRVLVQMGTAVLTHSISASRGLVALLG
jgi:flagellin